MTFGYSKKEKKKNILLNLMIRYWDVMNSRKGMEIKKFLSR